jgi:hypothetical protein
MNTTAQTTEIAAVAAGLEVPARVPTVDEKAKAAEDKRLEKETRKALYAEQNKNRKELADKLKASKVANAETETNELAQLQADAAELSKTDSSLRAVLIRRKLQQAKDKYTKLARTAQETARHNRVLATATGKVMRLRTPAEQVAYEARKAKAAAKKAAGQTVGVVIAS